MRLCDCGCGRPMVGRGPTELFFDDTHKRRATSRLLQERFKLIEEARNMLKRSNWRDDDAAERVQLFDGLATSAWLAGSAKHGIPASPDLLDLAEKLRERGQRTRRRWLRREARNMAKEGMSKGQVAEWLARMHPRTEKAEITLAVTKTFRHYR